MFLLLMLVSLLSPKAFSQQTLELTQSSSGLVWEKIENDFVEVIYPNYLRPTSVYIANLVEHYSQYVGLTYGIEKPQKFPLILRAEMADPNGFVTLAPRRSEWYSSSSFTNFVGSSEWYQTLAIHEYRHLNQYDHYNQKLVSKARWFFGDMAQFFAMFTGLQSWYFEGDAVWAETKYTDAGRGRSPLFLARLKALLQSGQRPTYDQFVNGTFQTHLPNQYIYGYALISYATKKFGEDFWRKVTADIAAFPHPRRLYSSFEKVSGQNFEAFFNEAMEDLRTKWSADQLPKHESDYRENLYPFKLQGELYHLSYNLDSFFSIMKGNEKIVEIPFVKEIHQLNLSQNFGVYTQFLPHKRYGYKGSSDVILVDLKQKTTKKITTGERFYNPKLNQSATKILATEFTPEHEWVLTELDLSGAKLRTTKLTGMIASEAYHLTENDAVAIVADKNGHKSIQKVNLSNGSTQELLPASRNNIFALFVDTKGQIFFEAQYKGHVEIFALKNQNELSRCTQVKVMANSPSSDGETLFYSDVDGDGSQIRSMPLSQCQALAKTELVNFNYLSADASDNYNNFPLKAFEDQEALHTKNAEKYQPESYNDFTKEVLIPHTWGFLGGRGLEASARTDNFLRTMSLYGRLGSTAEENANFAELGLMYKRYYPIFDFSAGMKRRAVSFFNTTDDLEWKEKNVGLDVALPYIYRSGLYTFNSTLIAGAHYLATSEYERGQTPQTSSNANFHQGDLRLHLKYGKDLTARSIISPLSFQYQGRYNRAEALGNSNASSHLQYHGAEATLPGFWSADGFRLTAEQETQKGGNGYRYLPTALNPLGYVFSRGYAYKSTDEYQKLTGNYVFPLISPDFTLGGWFYVKRITSNLFFDSTRAEFLSTRATYNSYGGELEFDSKILRILPLKIGVRYANKMKTHSEVGEVYTNFSSLF